MINFPQLQIHVVNHCNYSCEACAAFSSILPKRFYQAEEYIEVLEKLQTYSTISLIQFMGGEPTLHPNLAEFISKIREHTNAKVSLITNGWWLSQYEDEKFIKIIKTVDVLDFSPHPENKLTHEEQYEILRKIQNYGVKSFIRYANYFYVFNATEITNNRKECIFFSPGNAPSCPPLRPNGLAACNMVAFSPEEICSKEFNSQRKTGYFDIMQGDEIKLSEWLSKLPECCNYCTSTDTFILHPWKKSE